MEEAAAALLDQARCLHSPSSLALFVFTLLFTVLPEMVLRGWLIMAGFSSGWKGRGLEALIPAPCSLLPLAWGKVTCPELAEAFFISSSHQL